MPELLTADAFRKVLPKSYKPGINLEVLKYVNDLIIDHPDENEDLGRDLVTYTSVMQEGKFKISEYINAVRYVCFKLKGDSDIAAYTRVFPDRYQSMVNKGVDPRDISSMITSYKKGKLVNSIFAQTLVPTHVINHHIYQEAINTQAGLMRTARSEQVRMKAAECLIVNLKAPEVQQIELNVGIKNDPAIEELRETTRALAQQQRELLLSGSVNAREIAHSKILKEEPIEAEFTEEGE